MYLLTWNPSIWDWETLAEDVAAVKENGAYRMRWSCGRTRRILVGDRLFLMRLGVEPKGIVGSAFATVAPYEDQHWNPERSAEGDVALFVEADFDHLEIDPVITFEELGQPPFSAMKWTPQSSGIRIPGEIGDTLAELWARRTGAGSERGPDEMLGDSALIEGASRSVTVNSYERNSLARRRCLEHYGAVCFVCQMSFGATYGDFAAGYMHVHHVRQLSDLQQEYVVDPVADLRPLCPNCHAAIHLSSPLMSPEQMRATFIAEGRLTSR